MTKGSEPILYLSHDTLSSLAITAREAVDIIEYFLREQSQEKAWTAPKVALSTPDGRYMNAMLAAADDPSLIMVKSVALNPRNSERGQPIINGSITLLDGESGKPVAILDGNWVTAVRTAALSAVAALRLAPPEPSSMGFVGCGVQARSHLRIFSELFPIKEIHAFGRGEANRDRLCQEAEGLGLGLVKATSAQAVLKEADIVVSAVTRSAEMQPFLSANSMKKASLAIGTDMDISWKPETLASFDRIFVDDEQQEAAFDSTLVREGLIAGDLMDLVTGKKCGRLDASERIAFMFRGLSLGDLALASLVYRKAREAEVGLLIQD